MIISEGVPPHSNLKWEYGDIFKLKEENISLAVFGLPLNMNGTEGEMVDKVRIFAEQVKQKCGVEYEFFDERLTSVQAEAALNEMNVSRKKKKEKLDIVSAQILLQCYLDSRPHLG